MDTNNKPSVSVIIPTKNRAEDLAKTIESLLFQTRPPAEVIIVDQSPEKSWSGKVSLPVRYIHDPGIQGAADARNAAMEIACGDIWLFLDDDVVLERTFIQEILNAYGPDVTGVSGVITNYKKPPLLQRVWEHIFLRGPYHDDRQVIYRKAERLQNQLPLRVRQFGAGLMSFRASSIRGLRFDTNLKSASPGEDIDFCARLPKGSTLLMTPRGRLFHKRSPESRDSSHWTRVHAQVSSYMRGRHWKRGFWNHLCFGWLNVGYAVAAAYSCLRQRSLAPWQNWREGIRAGRSLALRGTRCA